MNTLSQSIRPAQVTSAAILLVASAGLRVVEFFVHAGHRSVLDYLVWAGLTLLLVLLALVFLRGKNWARWFYLAVIAIGLFGLPGLFERALARSTFSTIYLCLQTLLQVSPAILLFMRPSNEWFRGHRNAV